MLLFVNFEKAKAGQTYMVSVLVDKGVLQLNRWQERNKFF